jgi:hypothetical protein
MATNTNARRRDVVFMVARGWRESLSGLDVFGNTLGLA